MTKSFAAKALRVLAVVALASCFGESTGPDMGYARLNIVPQFDLHGLNAVDVNRVRVLITRPGGASVLVDTIVPFPANSDTLDLSFAVVISGSQENLELSLFMLDDPGGNIVFQSGPDPFVAVAGSTPGPPVTPVPLYVGTGSNAVGVRFVTTHTAVPFGDSVLFTAEAFDAGNVAIPGTPIIWTSSDTTRAIVRNDTMGLYVARPARGPTTVTARLLLTSTSTPPAFVASQLLIQPLPSAIVIQSGGGQSGGVGQALAQQVVVRVNAADNLGVAGVPVNFAVTSGGGTLSALADTTDAQGDARVSWTLGSTLGSQAISATVATLPAATVSVPATGVAGPPTQLAFTSVPSNATVGAVITPAVTVTARDQFGNTATSFVGNVTIALAANPAAGTLSGTTTMAAVAGVATFTDLVIDSAGTGYGLSASASGLTGATSSTFSVAPGAATQLSFTTQPVPATAGVAFGVVVTARDNIGNVASGFTGNVTVSIAAGTGTANASLSGTATVAAVAGVATFSGLTIDSAGTGYGLSASASGLTSATSSAFPIAAGAAAQLSFTTQPVPATAGVAFGVVVTARDNIGNVANGFTGNVTVAIAAGTGTSNASLSGASTVAAVAGVATFTGLTIDSVGTGYGLTASASGLTGATSSAFTIAAGAPAQLSFTTLPASTTAGVAFGAVVTARDNQGNVTTGFTGNVTMALANNPTGATLSGTLTQAAVAGVATFTNLSLDNVGAGYTFQATATGLTAATSSAISVTAPTSVKVWLNAAGGNWSTGSNWSGGTVPAATDTVWIKTAGTYTVDLDVSATIARLEMGGPSGAQTLQLTTGTLTLAGPGILASNTQLTLNGGVLRGTGTLTTAGGFTWLAGQLGGDGGTLSAGGVTILGGATTHSFINHTLEVAGTGTWSGTGQFNTGSAATIRVPVGGSLDVQGDGLFVFNQGGATSRLEVFGTVTRSVSAGAFTFGGAVDNSGSVTVSSGTMALGGGGSSAGNFVVGAGATLDFGGGTHALSTTGTITGPGTVAVNGGTVNAAGVVSLAGAGGIQISSGTFNYSSTNPGTTPNLTLSGGTLGGSVVGLLNVTNAMTWSGGALNGSGGTTRVTAGGSLTMGGAATLTFTNYVLELAGTGTWSGTASMNSGSGATLRVLAGGTLDLQADVNFNFNQGGSQSRFHNQGTVNRTTGTGTFTVGSLFDNDGAVSVQSGLLSLLGGGTSTGSYTAGPVGVLSYDGGTHALSAASSITGAGVVRSTGGATATAGSLSVTGTFGVLGGAFDYNGAGTATAQNAAVNGGTLGGSGLITVSGALNFISGGVSGTGTTQVLSGGILSISTAATKSMVGYRLENAGTGTWVAGNFNSGSGAILRNLAGGTLDISAGLVFSYNLGGAAPAVENAGTLIKSGTGVAVMGAPFVNTGSVFVTGDTLRISAGGSLGSNLSATTGTIELNAGAYTLVPGMSLTGAGGLYLSGATLTIAAANDSVSVENLRFDNGTINGAGILRIVTALQWNGGALGGTTTTRILPAASATLAGGTKSLTGGVLENDGTFSWTLGQLNTGSVGTIRNLPGRTITTNGTLTMAYNQGGGPPVLDNQGTLLLNGGSLTVGALLNNSGVLDLSAGDLILTGGGTLSGSATALNTLFFNAGSYDLLNGFSTSGSGDVFLAGATLTVGGGASVSMARLIFNSGTLDNQGALGVTSRLEWAGGSMTGAGITNVTGPATLAMLGGTKTLTGAHTLDLSGTGAWTAGAVNSGSGAMLRVLASGNLTNSGTGAFNYNLGGAQSQFVIEGAFLRTTALGFFNVGAFFVDTALGASVTVASGTTMNLLGGGRIANTPSVAGLLNLSSPVSFKTGAAVAGGGLVQVNSAGTLSTDSAGTVTIPNLDLIAGGTIDHEGLLIVTSQMNWSGGTLTSNLAGLGGITRINAGALLNISTTATKTYTGTHELDNQGTINFAAGDINTGSGAVIRNGQAFNWTGDTRILYNLGGATPVFRNLVTGTVSRTTGTGLAQLGSSLENAGAISVSSGTLSLAGGSGIPFTGFATQTGAGILDVSGGTFIQNGPFTVTGNIGISGGTWNPGGQTFTVNGNLTTSGSGALTMTTASDSVDISGTATFGGGNGILNAGVIRLAGNFSQVGAGAHFAPTAQSPAVAHRVVLDALTGTQTINFADPANSFFRRLILQRGGGTSTVLQTDVRTTFFSMAGGTYSMTGVAGPPITRLIADTVAGASSGSVSMQAPLVLVVNGVMVDSNVVNVDTVVYAGANQVIRNTAPGGFGNYTYRSIRVAQTTGTATFAVNFSLANDLVVSSGTLNLTGRQIGVAGNFRTENTGALQMTGATDSLGVGSSVNFSGGSTSTLLTNGRITTLGSFTQGGSANSFAPSGAQKVRLTGTTTQNVQFGTPGSSFFHRLEVAGNARNVVLQTNAQVNDSLIMLGGGGAANLVGAGTSQRLRAQGVIRLTLQTQSPLLAPPVLELSGAAATFSADTGFTGTRGMSPDTTVFLAGQTVMQDGTPLRYRSVRVATGGVLTYSTAGINDSVAGDLIADGSTFAINLGTLTAVRLRTINNGVLRMQTVGTQLIVGDSAIFAGGSTVGQLTSGTLQVRGNFVQQGGSTSAYAPSVGHVTLFASPTTPITNSTIFFADPTTSFFHNLSMSKSTSLTRGTVTLLSEVRTGGNVTVSNSTDLRGPGPRLRVGGVLTATVATTSPTINTLLALEMGLAPTVNISGVTADTIVFNGALANVPVTGFSYDNVRINTSGTIGMPNVTLAGDLDVATGTASLAGNNIVINGKLRTRGTGTITMPIGPGAPGVTVADSAIFGGGSTAGLLQAGTLRLGGAFFQGGGNTAAYQANPGHVTEFNNVARRGIAMANPGTGAANSRFGRMALARAGGVVSVDLVTSIQAASISDTSLGFADTLSGTGQAITADSTGGFGLSNTVFNGPTLTLSHGTALQSLSVVRFQNMDPTTTFLSMFRNPAFQVTMNTIVFASAHTTGRYFSGTTAAAGPAGVFSFLTSQPVAPGFQAANGDYVRLGPTPATVNWNGVTNP